VSNTRILPSTVRRGIGVAGAGVLLVLASHPAWSDTPEHTYSFAIVPQHKATDLAKRWTPLLQYLSEKTGYRFEFRTARDIPTFEQRLMQSEYDVAYLNPLQHVVFRQTTGYRAIARESGRSLHGILVVRADSPYHSLRDLQGQTLAFPAPSAFAASLLTRARLRAEDVRIVPNFVVSHDSVYYGVANGLFAAGGGARQTLDRLEPKVREKLRMLWMSEEYPPHPFVVHPRVPAAVTAALLQALTGMGNDARGRRLLTTCARWCRFCARRFARCRNPTPATVPPGCVPAQPQRAARVFCRYRRLSRGKQCAADTALQGSPWHSAD
jgi:phosphonate transport system substrate-binding protein